MILTKRYYQEIIFINILYIIDFIIILISFSTRLIYNNIELYIFTLTRELYSLSFIFITRLKNKGKKFKEFN